MLAIGLIGFLASFSIALVLIRLRHWHGRYSYDDLENRPQKFHAHPVPRIGGIAIFTGFFFALKLGAWSKGVALWGFGSLLLSSLPIFIGGLAEDLTKLVGPLTRISLTFITVGLGVYLLGGRVVRLDIPAIDAILVSYPAFSLFLTFLAVGGVTNAMNIVDGYNGLCGMVSMMIFAALAYVSFQVNDPALVAMCLAAIGATAGYLVWNYPKGLMFAGDGGAYFLGFIIAEISVMLVARHTEISPLFPLLLVAYPVWETVFTIYRRKFLQNRAVDSPDAMHLHQMIYKRLVRWKTGSKNPNHLIQRSSLTSPYLWGIASLSIIPAMIFWKNPHLLAISMGLFIVFYVWFYRQIVKFNCPQWLVLHSPASLPEQAISEEMQ
ncbi:MAG: glycosyltransferase [Burkholderiales bacterium]|nr:glycosyltransferase [Burkholderiales bacterium]